MTVKRQWLLRTHANVGTRLRHLYNGNTMTGASFVIYMGMSVADGPQKDRDVVLELTPEEAEVLADRLTRQAAYTRKRNQEM